MLKFIVSLDYKKFKFEDSASAMTFAAIAKKSSINEDELRVVVEVIEEDDADV